MRRQHVVGALSRRRIREDTMKLTSEQLKAFDEQGYLFFPDCFSEAEVAVLRSEADSILRSHRQEVWREKLARALRLPPTPTTTPT